MAYLEREHIFAHIMIRIVAVVSYCLSITIISLSHGGGLLLHAPAVCVAQGSRTVPENMCYIQFLTNEYITVVTAIAAFYGPVVVMCFLYGRIYRETERRRVGLAQLQAHRRPSTAPGQLPLGGVSTGSRPIGREDSSDGDVRLFQLYLRSGSIVLCE